jgi:hypothetical protein
MPLRSSVLRTALAHRLSIRMASTATGRAGRHYALGALLQRHPQDSSLGIYKAEYGCPKPHSHLTHELTRAAQVPRRDLRCQTCTSGTLPKGVTS